MLIRYRCQTTSITLVSQLTHDMDPPVRCHGVGLLQGRIKVLPASFANIEHDHIIYPRVRPEVRERGLLGDVVVELQHLPHVLQVGLGLQLRHARGEGHRQQAHQQTPIVTQNQERLTQLACYIFIFIFIKCNKKLPSSQRLRNLRNCFSPPL